MNLLEKIKQRIKNWCLDRSIKKAARKQLKKDLDFWLTNEFTNTEPKIMKNTQQFITSPANYCPVQGCGAKLKYCTRIGFYCETCGFNDKGEDKESKPNVN